MSFDNASEDISIEVFQKLGEELFELRELKQKFEDETSKVSEKLEAKKRELLTIMEKAGLDNQRIAGLGIVYTQSKFTVSMPKDPEKKKDFFNYLREKGIFEDTVTVHSNTLNSYYKTEMDNAIEAGNTDFKIPGLDEPKLVKTLNMRKG